MKPYYKDKWVTLYCGDALECMQDILQDDQFEWVNLVIVDPPFNLNKEFDTLMSAEKYKTWCDKWITLCWDMAQDDASFFLMTIQEYVGDMMEFLELGGEFRNQIIWFNSSMPVKTRFCIGYQPILWYAADAKDYVFNYGAETRQSNAALPWGRENKAHSIKDIWDDIPFISGGCMAAKEAILAPGSKRKAHSAQMPLALANRMIKYCSNEGDTVFDPFAGSGTTLVSAKRLKRKAIGIERNKDYCDIIVRRLKERAPIQMKDMFE